jgi:hypothetical protein
VPTICTTFPAGRAHGQLGAGCGLGPAALAWLADPKAADPSSWVGYRRKGWEAKKEKGGQSRRGTRLPGRLACGLWPVACEVSASLLLVISGWPGRERGPV